MHLKSLMLLGLVASSAAAQTTTVYVVRHAEKAGEGMTPAPADPALTAGGTARANTLADMLREAGIQGVITTQFERTKATGLPVATRLGLTEEIVDARAPMHAKLVADSVLQKHKGQSVLVVGHSNTVPDIIAALGAPKPSPICDAGYDNLYIVTVPSSGTPSVARLHFGEKTTCP
jgi:broad specificity phosphatase PhoE